MIVLGTSPPCWSKKIQRITWNIPSKCCVWSTICTRHKTSCLEEAIWLWIYLVNFKSNQNWYRIHTETFSEKKESQRIVSYNLTETTPMFLWFLQWQKRSAMLLQLRRISKTENRGIQKLTLHNSYLSKWQNSKSSEFLNIFFTSVPCWLRYNQWEVLLFSLLRFFSQHITAHLMIFVWQATARESSHIFVACFLMVKIMLIYAKIQQWT